MLCYECAKKGVKNEAVAICIVCGMGVCNDHLVRSDIVMWEGSYPFPPHKLTKKLPRFLCQDCHSALAP